MGGKRAKAKPTTGPVREGTDQVAAPIFAFDDLIDAIRAADHHFRREALRAVNVGLTLRNWCIGLYAAEFELRGADRALYGDRLFEHLSQALQRLSISNVGRRQLYQYVAFYRTYPEIVRTLPAQSRLLLEGVLRTPIVPALSAQLEPAAEVLAGNLSYSHLQMLTDLDDSEKRRFYEEECLRSSWSVRELRRQISSLLYERTALSTRKEGIAAKSAGAGADGAAVFSLRDPYVFEFLGVRPREVMGESQLEDALLDKVESFLLELGRGFCFEARQKRLLIGDDFFFVDLVFYHRLLKCHVLVELKADEFRHEHLGQLNTYVNWFRKHEMTEGDSPPIGLLLCTRKNHALVEYALAGMDNQLFVSRYQLVLPKREELERVLEAELVRVSEEGHRDDPIVGRGA